jgi:hypothetical protein
LAKHPSTERRKTIREEREVAICSVLADGAEGGGGGVVFVDSKKAKKVKKDM